MFKLTILIKGASCTGPKPFLWSWHTSVSKEILVSDPNPSMRSPGHDAGSMEEMKRCRSSKVEESRIALILMNGD